MSTHRENNHVLNRYDCSTKPDLTIRVRGKDILVHKALMTTASQYFKILFNGNFGDSETEVIDMSEFEPDIVEEVLSYIYCGEANLRTDTVAEIYAFADFLQLDALPNLCIDFMQEFVDFNSFIAYWKLAELYSLPRFKYFLQTFIWRRLDDFMQSAEFLELDLADVKCLMGGVDINQTEFPKLNEKIYLAVRLWVKHNAKERQVHLGDLLQLVKPQRITQKFLNKVVPKSNLMAGSMMANRWLLDNFTVEPQCINSYTEKDTRFDNNIFIMNDKEWFSACPGKFERLIERPSLVENFCGLAYEKNVYIFGGKAGRAVKCDVEMDEWTAIPFEQHLFMHSGAVLGSTAYLAGGYRNGECLDTVYQYDFHRGVITEGPRMKTRRALHGSAAYGNCIYVCGGAQSTINPMLGLTECMDIREGIWRTLPDMQFRQGICNSAIVNNKLYCLESPSRRLQKYDLRQCRWEELGIAPGFLGWLVAFDEKLYQVHTFGVSVYKESLSRWDIYSSSYFNGPVIATAY